MQKQNKKNLIIQLKIEEHAEIKKRAAERNISIKQYVLQAIEQRMAYENKYN